MFRTLSGRYSFTTSSNTSLLSYKSTKGSISMILSVYNYFFAGSDQNVRPFSTNNPIMSSDVADLFHPRLKTIFQQLDSLAPRFVLNSGDIQILTHPHVFYSTLKDKILSSKRRVYLSSLYIGKTQHELVNCLDEALTKNEELKVYLLTDVLRGTREAPNGPCSASLLVPLVKKHGKHRVDIRMYHTPHLNGIRRSVTPKRVNEMHGLQHMKLYGFDDEVMLSGANLSEDYFTDRQDRYYLFRSKPLSDYYFDIHSAVASLSYQILESKEKQGFRLDWPTSNSSCEPHMNHQRFISDSSFLLEPLLKQHKLKSFEQFNDTDKFDTIVYPVSQFTPLMQPNYDPSTEKPVILRLLSYLDSPSVKWWFTAGYFNMYPQIQERLLNGLAKGTVITAAPQANSFYKSAGFSYYIPEAYLLFAKKFLEEVAKRGKQGLIKLYEWKNGVVNTPGGWSYHAKGLWITVPEDPKPSITIIGSSNYTKRAYLLDLESNAVVITKDENLKQQMSDEVANLMKFAEPLELDDFKPKPKPVSVADGAEPGNKEEEGESRHISYAAQLAVKVLGGKF